MNTTYRSFWVIAGLLVLSGCTTLKQTISQIIPKKNKIIHQAPLVQTLNLPSPDFLATAFSPLPVLPITPVNLKTLDTSFEAAYANANNLLGEEMIEFAKKHVGVRYRYAGRNPKYGFDCSGFTSFVAQNFGYTLSPACSGQSVVGVDIPLSEAQKGDLLFFGYKRGKGKQKNYTYISHVGMVSSGKGETLAMIHAARRGIVVEDINSVSWRSYFAPRFLFAKRINTPEELEKLKNPIF